MLDIVIIGAGSMGSRHAAVVEQHRQTRLAAVVDIDESRRRQLARRFSTLDFPDLPGLLEKITPDAVIVATPATSHAAISIALSQARIPHLIEKPIATTLSETIALAAAARETTTAVWVGHLERFNPALEHLLEVFDKNQLERASLRTLQSLRCRSRPEHIGDVGVTFDLAVHDLDILLQILACEPQCEPQCEPRIMDVQTRTTDGVYEDFLRARLQWSEGSSPVVANITSHWRAERFNAHLRLDLAGQSIFLDYPGQQLLLTVARMEQFHYRPESRVNPLQRQFEHFVRSLCGPATVSNQLCDMDQGIRTVALAERLLTHSQLSRESLQRSKAAS